MPEELLCYFVSVNIEDNMCYMLFCVDSIHIAVHFLNVVSCQKYSIDSPKALFSSFDKRQ